MTNYHNDLLKMSDRIALMFYDIGEAENWPPSIAYEAFITASARVFAEHMATKAADSGAMVTLEEAGDAVTDFQLTLFKTLLNQAPISDEFAAIIEALDDKVKHQRGLSQKPGGLA